MADSVWTGKPSSVRLERAFCWSRGRGFRRGDHGGAGRAGGVMVVEEQGSEASTHVPLDMVAEHAQQDVGAHPVRSMVMDGSHHEVHGFEGRQLPVTKCFGR